MFHPFHARFGGVRVFHFVIIWSTTAAHRPGRTQRASLWFNPSCDDKLWPPAIIALSSGEGTHVIVTRAMYLVHREDNVRRSGNRGESLIFSCHSSTLITSSCGNPRLRLCVCQFVRLNTYYTISSTKVSWILTMFHFNETLKWCEIAVSSAAGTNRTVQHTSFRLVLTRQWNRCGKTSFYMEL